MGYELDAFVSRLSVLQAWKREIPSLRFCPLGKGLAILPDAAPELGRETDECGRKLSAKGVIAFIEAFEHGDTSGADATVWKGGHVVAADIDINKALRMLGVFTARFERRSGGGRSVPNRDRTGIDPDPEFTTLRDRGHQ
jgi:hypothetical protein